MPPLRASSAFALTLLLSSVLSPVPSAAAAQDRLIVGRVTDPLGVAVVDATIIATSGSSRPIATRTNAAGRFELSRLRDAPYDVRVSAPGLNGEAVSITPAASPVPLDIVLRVSALTESLLVSASQIDQPLSQTADSVTIVTGADLQTRQISSLGDALRGVPGFTVATTGGPGTVTSIFPRGGESDFTLVLVDGVRANAFGGGMDISQVTLADIDRVEVVRGPQSAVFGADAIGGVVQIITRQGGRASGHAQIETGSRRTRRLQASTVGEHQGLGWQAGADYFADAGFTGRTPAGERVTNDDAEAQQAWAGASWRSTHGTAVQGQFRYVDTDRGAPGPFGSDPAGRFSGVDLISRGTTQRRSMSVRGTQPWGGAASRVRQRVEFDRADFDLQFVSPFGPSSSSTERSHLRVQTDAAISTATGLSAGVEWLSERGLSSFIQTATGDAPIDRHVVGVFGEWRWQGPTRLSAQLGVRAEHITREVLAVNGFAEDTVLSVNPKVSLSWIVSPGTPSNGSMSWTRLRAAAGTGIRPPDVFEIAFTDNPGLKPERSRSVEVGVTQVIARGAAQFDANMFVNRYDDLIVSVGSLRDVSRYRTDNVSNARARGVELGGSWQVTRAVNLRASYTRLSTEILAVDGASRAPSPYQVGDPLLRRPRHSGALAVTVSQSRWSSFLSLDARGQTLDAEPAFGPSGGLYSNRGRAIVDAGSTLKVSRFVDVLIRGLNLLDRQYEDVLGFPSPSRTAFIGVRLAARR